jgi:predicted ATPase
MINAAKLTQAGHGQIVAAIAEAGTGKSRLFFEFKTKNRSGWMVLETFSVSHGKASAYLPVLDLLHSYFDIKSEDDARKRREKVNGRIVTLDPALEDTRPYLFALLGIVEGEDPLAQMNAQTKKRRTLDAIKRVLLRESLNQPLIVMFEDLHWIDEQTQVFLNLLADSIANAKILLLGIIARNTPISGIARPTTRSCGSIRWARNPPTRCSRRCSVTAINWPPLSALSSRRPKVTRSLWKRRCRCCSTRAR